MSDFAAFIRRCLSELSSWILRGLAQVQDAVLRALGHGFRVALFASTVVGASAFFAIREILKYTPVGFSVADATAKWERFLGANAEFWAWLFYDVLAFDYGVNLALSAIGFVFAANFIYFLISGVLLVAKRI